MADYHPLHLFINVSFHNLFLNVKIRPVGQYGLGSLCGIEMRPSKCEADVFENHLGQIFHLLNDRGSGSSH